MRSTSLTLAAVSLFLALVSPAVAAADAVPWPLRVVGVDGAVSRDVRLDKGLANELKGLEQITFQGVEMPDGRVLDMQLSRVRVMGPDARLAVNGVEQSTGGHPDLTMWSGELEQGGTAFLAFSSHGTRGLIEMDDRRYHLTAERGPDGSFFKGGSRLSLALPEFEFSGELACGTDLTMLPPGVPAPSFELPPDGFGPSELHAATGGAPAPTYECALGIETDYQLQQLLGGPDNLQVYIESLVGATCTLYDVSASVAMTIGYLGIWTTTADPWSAPDSASSNMVTLLQEFQGQWGNGAAPVEAPLYHFLSGVNLGGGVAYLDVLCHSSLNFGVSTGIDGNLTFPVSQGNNVWDFKVFSHELGHNFGLPHTHDTCPPIDKCAPSWAFGQCQNSQVCGSGTIMSYCQLCNGGLSNIVLEFDPYMENILQQSASNGCLPPFVDGIVPDLQVAYAVGPELAEPGDEVTLTVRVDSLAEPYDGEYTIDVRLSDNASITWLDTSIGQLQLTDLDTDVEVQVQIPFGFEEGLYYWGVTLEPVEEELATANNFVTGNAVVIQQGKGPGTPNLRAVSVQGPTFVQPGDVVKLTRDIMNLGDPLITEFVYSVRLSEDDVITESDLQLATLHSTSLGALGIVGVKVPADTPGGTYRWGLMVTPAFGEEDDTDNTVVGNAVTVGVPQGSSMFVPGDRLVGVIATPSDVDEIAFDAVAGSRIRFSGKSLGLDLEVRLLVKEPGAQGFVEVGQLRKRNRRSYVAPVTGQYLLRLESAVGFGSYTIDTSARNKKRWRDVFAPEDGVDQFVAVGAVPGATVEMKAKVVKPLATEGGVTPVVVAPNGFPLNVTSITYPVGKGAKLGFGLSELVLDEVGDYLFWVIGIDALNPKHADKNVIRVSGKLTLPEGGDTQLMD